MTTLSSQLSSPIPPPTPASGPPEGLASRFDWPTIAKIIGIAFGAYALSFYFFAPRFALWNGLYVDPAHSSPEVNRAVDAIRQLEDPFVKIDNPSNVVLQWRLLFPLIGHYLHLPVGLYLAFPQIGCALTLIYIAHISRRYAGPWRDVFLLTTLMATASWFFISNGWLSYEDSWYVLGLMLVSFSRSRALLITACVTEPFIDERFVLTIPLALAVRFITVPMTAEGRRQFMTDAMIVVGVVIPYVLLRIFALSHDAGSSSYLKNRMSELHDPIPFSQYLLGPWMGLRLLWIGVIAAVWRTFTRNRMIAGACMAAAVLFSTVVALVIAADLSRSMSAALPAALLGLFLLLRDFPQVMYWGLPTMLAVNLLMPAWNVVTLFNEPIYYLYASMSEYAHPPTIVNAEVYVHDAQMLINSGKASDAKQFLDWAMRLDPASSGALMTRALVKVNGGDTPGAVTDADAALALTPDNADALFTRAYVHLKQGHGGDALIMMQRALAAGGPQWAQKAQCESLISQLQKAAPPAPTSAGPQNGQPANRPSEAPWHLSL